MLLHIPLLLASCLLALPSAVKQAVRAYEQQEWPQAQALIDEATAASAPTAELPSAWYYRGVIYERRLRNGIATEEATALLAQALAAYRQVLALAPAASQYHSFAQINLNGLWEYYLDRGVRYYRQEAFERAMAQFDVCRGIKPQDPSAYLYAGTAAHQQEQCELALHYYEQYLKLGGNSPAAYRAVADLTATFLKKPLQALATLEKALLQHPFSNDLLYAQLQLYVSLGRAEEKERLLTEQMAAAPSAAAYPYQLGYLYERQAQPDRALACYRQAAALAPNEAAPVRQQGAVLYDEAVRLLNEVAAMPEEAFQEVGKERMEQFRAQLRLALPCLERARKLQPRDVWVLQRLQTIYRRLDMPRKRQRTEQRLRKINML